MNCAECEVLEAQGSIAEEEVAKLRERIAAALSEERRPAPPGLLRALETWNARTKNAWTRSIAIGNRTSGVSDIAWRTDFFRSARDFIPAGGRG